MHFLTAYLDLSHMTFIYHITIRYPIKMYELTSKLKKKYHNFHCEEITLSWTTNSTVYDINTD